MISLETGIKSAPGRAWRCSCFSDSFHTHHITDRLSGVQKKLMFPLKKEACAGALEGSLLRSLTQLTSAKVVIEVGMFVGSTTLAIAAALPENGKV